MLSYQQPVVGVRAPRWSIVIVPHLSLVWLPEGVALFVKVGGAFAVLVATTLKP
jgi:hypothetical protein